MLAAMVRNIIWFITEWALRDYSNGVVKKNINISSK